MALIPALGRQRQENLCEFKASLVKTARATLFQKQTNKQAKVLGDIFLSFFLVHSFEDLCPDSSAKWLEKSIV
jgi:acyl carrier protein phosphodiesterase